MGGCEISNKCCSAVAAGDNSDTITATNNGAIQFPPLTIDMQLLNGTATHAGRNPELVVNFVSDLCHELSTVTDHNL